VENDSGPDSYHGDLDCSHFDGLVIVDGYDCHGLDTGNDRIGCEANG
jgi:hypothetical protein